ncbi:MAG: hypothetical protein FD122_3 [Stygiobacter sp.]|nr:MAG: hypothetical protein FD122_3 [Stygiobacter sp.]KAF0217239.1 MAG: hypothetical protein FD178_775 [Ignavibacteria bacterium]
MKSILILSVSLLTGILLSAQVKTDQTFINSKKEKKMDTTVRQIFIDKFLVPEKAIQEFKERTKISLSYIAKQPGFIKLEAYERFDENGNLIYIGIVVWENDDAFKKAKAAVDAEYKKQGFNPKEMMERLHIILERDIYTEVETNIR